MIDGENFPDENFREYVSEHFDEDKDGRLSGNEAESVSSIDVSEQNILTLKGIEFFSGLTYLVCSGNNLSSLDVSKNTVLTDLDCSDNLYTIPSGDTLDLSDLPDFDVSRADNWENGTVEGTVLTATGATVQYTYDCGNGFVCDFTIVFQENIIQENGDDSAEVKEENFLEENFPEENFQEENLSDENLCEYVSGESDEDGDDRLSEDVAEESEAVYFLASDPTADIEINEDNFPDEIFREYVSEEFDGDGDGWLSEEEIGNISSINVFEQNITTLKGIEFFSELTYFNCSGNNLSSLDVSGNTTLRTLRCDNNNLSNLDVSGNTELSYLNCDDNNLSSLDVSHNLALTRLWCGDNNLSDLDVSHNTALTELHCGHNGLSSLDVSRNTALGWLACPSNNLSSLDVSANTALWLLDCSVNNLNNLDVNQNTALTKLYCRMNNLRSLDISSNTALTVLECSSNNLSSLDVSNNMTLTDFECIDNVYPIPSGDTLDLSTLPGFDVSKAGNWQNGTVNGTILTATGARVQYTYACGNGFTGNFIIANGKTIEINEENFPDEIFRGYVSEKFDKDKDDKLSVFEIENVSIINVSNKDISTLKGIEFFGNLTNLYCDDNNLSSLDVSHNTALKVLSCIENNLSSLDVSANPALEWLACGHNELSSLDVSANPVLTELYCFNNNLSNIDVSENMVLEWLNCTNNNLSSLDVSQNTALKTLVCCDNNLSSLDVNGNPALTLLNCHGNNLSSLDLSGNPALARLFCYNNNLSSLDISQNSMLTVLWCQNNNLSSLDVSQNPALTDLDCSDNVYPIPSGNTFDLSTLPGFDVSKASNWKNGTVNGTILTLTGKRVTYTYDCGQGFSKTFCLEAAQWQEPSAEPVSYNITYYLNGGTNNSKNPAKGSSDTAVTLQNPTRTGYKFLGWYTDAGFKQKVTSIPKDTESDVQLYAKWEHTAHTYKDKVTPATLSKDGSIQSTCSVCGAAKKATTISRPATIKLSAESYVYDGKVKKPTVTVKDKSGKTIAASNYTVTYASGRKNVGSYTVKVTFKGNYSGSKTLSFAINPAPAKSLSVSPGSGKLTVKWKKNATQISGYEIMYSTSSSFAKASTKTVTAKSSAAQKEIKKLKAKTTYYVRVRTYKTVGKQKYYSAWSKKVKVTTKK